MPSKSWLWQLRERAIRAALAKLADEHGVPNRFSAGDVADAIPRTAEYSDAWTPAQRYELAFFIRQSGRRLFPLVDHLDVPPIEYHKGWFVVRGEQSDAFAGETTHASAAAGGAR